MGRGCRGSESLHVDQHAVSSGLRQRFLHAGVSVRPRVAAPCSLSSAWQSTCFTHRGSPVQIEAGSTISCERINAEGEQSWSHKDSPYGGQTWPTTNATDRGATTRMARGGPVANVMHGQIMPGCVIGRAGGTSCSTRGRSVAASASASSL